MESLDSHQVFLFPNVTMNSSSAFPNSSARAADYARAVFDSVDRMDAAGFAAWFTPAGRFVFGNADACIGQSAVRDAVAGFFQGLRGVRHDVHDVWLCGDALLCRVGATYTRLDGTRVSLPAATIWRGGDAGIDDYRIYADLAPLLSGAR